MVIIDNQSEGRVLVSVTNTAIPWFDASPVLVNAGSEEKWIRTDAETVVIMSRHGWFSCAVTEDGYVRISDKNLYVVQDWNNMETHFYSWYDDAEIDFGAQGFCLSLDDVREICAMEKRLTVQNCTDLRSWSEGMGKGMEYGGFSSVSGQVGGGDVVANGV